MWGRLRERYRTRRAFRWAVDALVVVVLLVGVGAWQTRGHVSGPVPQVALKTLAGEAVSLDALKGKPVLVAFWAPWCGVCKTVSPNVGWVRRVVGERAEVISIATAYNDLEEVKAYVRERGVDDPVWVGEGDVAAQFNVGAYPTVYFLGSDGKVKHSVVGYTTSVGLLLRLLF